MERRIKHLSSLIRKPQIVQILKNNEFKHKIIYETKRETKLRINHTKKLLEIFLLMVGLMLKMIVGLNMEDVMKIS